MNQLYRNRQPFANVKNIKIVYGKNAYHRNKVSFEVDEKVKLNSSIVNETFLLKTNQGIIEIFISFIKDCKIIAEFDSIKFSRGR